MKRVSVTIAVALGAVFGLPSCDEESDEDKVSRIVEEFVGEINQQIDIACDCYDEIGFESKSDCREEFGEILPARQRCIEDALAQDVAATEQYYGCRQPLEEEYTVCLNDKLECVDLSSDDPCDEDFTTGIKNCIELPNSVQRDFDDCFPSGD